MPATTTYAVRIEGISRREAARRFGIDPRTVAKMLSFSVPPGYRRSRPPARPKLDPFVGIIDRILEEDKGRPAKQRHTRRSGCCRNALCALGFVTSRFGVEPCHANRSVRGP